MQHKDEVERIEEMRGKERSAWDTEKQRLELEVEGAREECTELKGKLTENEALKASQQATERELTDALQELERKEAALKAALQEAEMMKSVLDAVSNALESQTEVLGHSEEELGRHTAGVEALGEHVAAALAHLVRVSVSEKDARVALEGEFKALCEDIAGLNQEVASLTAQLSEVTQAKKEAEDELAVLTSSFGAAGEASQEQSVRLNAKLIEAKEELQTAKAKYKAELEQVERMLQEEKQEKERVQLELDGVKVGLEGANEKVSGLVSEREEALRRVQELEFSRDLARQEQERVVKLVEQEKEMLDRHLTRLTGELATVSHDHVAANLALTELQISKSTLAKELEQSEARLKELETSLQQTQQALAEALSVPSQEMFAKLSAELEAEQQARSRVQRELDAAAGAHQELREVRSVLSGVECELDSSKRKLDMLGDTGVALEKAEATVREMTAANTKATLELTQLQVLTIGCSLLGTRRSVWMLLTAAGCA